MKRIFPVSRGEREIQKTNLVVREENFFFNFLYLGFVTVLEEVSFCKMKSFLRRFLDWIFVRYLNKDQYRLSCQHLVNKSSLFYFCSCHRLVLILNLIWAGLKRSAKKSDWPKILKWMISKQISFRLGAVNSPHQNNCNNNFESVVEMTVSL